MSDTGGVGCGPEVPSDFCPLAEPSNSADSDLVVNKQNAAKNAVSVAIDRFLEADKSPETRVHAKDAVSEPEILPETFQIYNVERTDAKPSLKAYARAVKNANSRVRQGTSLEHIKERMTDLEFQPRQRVPSVFDGNKGLLKDHELARIKLILQQKGSNKESALSELKQFEDEIQNRHKQLSEYVSKCDRSLGTVQRILAPPSVIKFLSYSKFRKDLLTIPSPPESDNESELNLSDDDNDDWKSQNSGNMDSWEQESNVYAQMVSPSRDSISPRSSNVILTQVGNHSAEIPDAIGIVPHTGHGFRQQQEKCGLPQHAISAPILSTEEILACMDVVREEPPKQLAPETPQVQSISLKTRTHSEHCPSENTTFELKPAKIDSTVYEHTDSLSAVSFSHCVETCVENDLPSFGLHKDGLTSSMENAQYHQAPSDEEYFEHPMQTISEEQPGCEVDATTAAQGMGQDEISRFYVGSQPPAVRVPLKSYAQYRLKHRLSSLSKPYEQPDKTEPGPIYVKLPRHWIRTGMDQEWINFSIQDSIAAAREDESYDEEEGSSSEESVDPESESTDTASSDEAAELEENKPELELWKTFPPAYDLSCLPYPNSLFRRIKEKPALTTDIPKAFLPPLNRYAIPENHLPVEPVYRRLKVHARRSDEPVAVQTVFGRRV